MRPFVFAALLILAAGGAVAAEDAADQGRELYLEHCASCHGAALEGQPDWKTPNEDGTLKAPPHDESGHTWHHGDRLLMDYVRLGGAETLRQRGVEGVQSGMPPFGDVLSDDEIGAILAYIRSHWSDRARAFQRNATDAEGG